MTKNRFSKVDDMVKEYFDIEHAEVVPEADLNKPVSQTFYLPIHAVYEQSSSTTKVRAVFDASAKLSTGKSSNDFLIVGWSYNPSLIDRCPVTVPNAPSSASSRCK